MRRRTTRGIRIVRSLARSLARDSCAQIYLASATRAREVEAPGGNLSRDDANVSETLPCNAPTSPANARELLSEEFDSRMQITCAHERTRETRRRRARARSLARVKLGVHSGRMQLAGLHLLGVFPETFVRYDPRRAAFNSNASGGNNFSKDRSPQITPITFPNSWLFSHTYIHTCIRARARVCVCVCVFISTAGNRPRAPGGTVIRVACGKLRQACPLSTLVRAVDVLYRPRERPYGTAAARLSLFNRNQGEPQVEEACEARSLFTTPLLTPCGTPCRGDSRTFSYAKPPLAGRGSRSRLGILLLVKAPLPYVLSRGS